MDFDIKTLDQMDRARLSSYRSNLDFYNGSQWTERSRYRQLVFNYARIAVDKVTSYLMNELNFACDAVAEIEHKGVPSGTTGQEMAKKAEDLIYLVYDQNNCSELDYTTEIDTAILGDGCYKVTWDAAEKRVRITAPDVNGIFAWWQGDDLSRLYRVASRYQLTAEEAALIYKQTITKKTAVITEVWDIKQFILYMDDKAIERKPNPYGFIPFIIFPNLRQPKQFWGLSDIPALREPQRELNRSLTQLSRILEVSGNPIAVLEGVEQSENILVQPGAVWNVPPDARAYLLDLLQGGGIRLHIDYIDLVYRTMHDLSESPRASYGGMGRDLSGIALEVELQSLLQKVRRKRLIRTNVYRRRNEMVLALYKKFARQDLTTVSQRILWGQVLPQDRAREAQNEQLMVQSGIHSRRTAMDNLDVRDPETEFEKWMAERRRILEMNSEFKVQPAYGKAREKSTAAELDTAL
jgi:hypothetical protein